MELDIPTMPHQPRRSRMHPTRTGKRIELTARDIEIFRLLGQYRYLRSTFIHAFVGGASETRLKERLGDLYHERYLDRPRQQWEFANCRYMPAVYELGEGARHVLHERGIADDEARTLFGQGRHRQFSHCLMICELLACIELGARAEPDLRFIPWPEILSKSPEETRAKQRPLEMPVSIVQTQAGREQRIEASVIPDALFGLEYLSVGERTYRFFALEADRATMPVGRSNLNQTSYLRKILGYRDILAREIHKSHLNIPNLLVLTATTNEHHMVEIMKLLESLTGRSAAFLFKAVPAHGSFERVPKPTPDLLLEPWSRVGFPPMRVTDGHASLRETR